MKFLFALGLFGFLAISLWVATSLKSDDDPTGVSTPATLTVTDLDENKDIEFQAPEATVEEKVFDFGTADPSKPDSHVFMIRNTGSAVLTIQAGRKSCKCVDLTIIDKEVQPGEVGRIQLKWESLSATGKFSESYSVYTNDPKQKEIRFSTKGFFKVGFWSTVGEFHAGVIEQGTPYSCFTHLYSQQWDDIYIREITSSIEDLQWSFDDQPVTDISELDATAVKTLKMRCPALTEKGPFKGYVQVIASPEENSPEEDWMTIDLTIDGTVIGKYLVTSDKFDYKNAFDFKSVRNDQEHKATFMVKVAANDKVLPEPVFTSYPDGLKLKWIPINPEKGVYRGELTIPKGLESGDYQQSKDEGWIRMDFEHPEVERIQIPMVLRLYSPSKDVSY